MIKLMVVPPKGKTHAYAAPSIEFCDKVIADGMKGYKYIVLVNGVIINEVDICG